MTTTEQYLFAFCLIFEATVAVGVLAWIVSIIGGKIPGLRVLFAPKCKAAKALAIATSLEPIATEELPPASRPAIEIIDAVTQRMNTPLAERVYGAPVRR